MAITVYNLKKWFLMLCGRSIYHVNQEIGKAISTKGISGYYNDLTEKVCERQEVDDKGIPLLSVDNGEKIYFPIMIFQYGLGAYDKYLLTNDESMFVKARLCADWALENQNENGSWNNFTYEFPEYPFSSMAQGEATSLLLRLYKSTGDEIYRAAAERAISFMLLGIELGGTTEYCGDDVFFHEFTHLPVVLNGWIFSIWGLYDYNLVCGNPRTQEVYEKTMQTLEKNLNRFDNGYWSMYNCAGMIASPFYHGLHIAQMEALYLMTQNTLFQEYQKRFEQYKRSWFGSMRAFLKKAFQKIREK